MSRCNFITIELSYINMTRRFFLKAISIFGLSFIFPKKIPADISQKFSIENIDALTNAIMPGSNEIGVHEKLRDLYSQIANKNKILTMGLMAMDRYCQERYSKPFYLLNEKERDLILKWMNELPPKRLENLFFTTFRKEVLKHYFTSPVVWKILRYNGPPQPKGFVNYHLPPGDKNELL